MPDSVDHIRETRAQRIHPSTPYERCHETNLLTEISSEWLCSSAARGPQRPLTSTLVVIRSSCISATALCASDNESTRNPALAAVRPRLPPGSG